MLMGERAILIKRREYTNMDKNSYEKKIQSLEEEIKIMKERYQILVETTSAILFEYKPAEDKMIFSSKVDVVCLVNGKLGLCKELDDKVSALEKSL